MLLMPSCGSEPPPSEHPLLWRIAGEPASYLYGTVHLPDTRVASWSEEVQGALAASDAVYTEISLAPEVLMKVVEGSVLPEGQTLRDLLPADVFARLESFCTAKGLNLAGMMNQQIWVVATNLTLVGLSPEHLTLEPLDMRLYRYATANRKEAGGIETAEEQLAAFGALTRDEQAEYLVQMLDLLEESPNATREYVEELVRIYRDGDAAALEAYMNRYLGEDDPLTVKFKKLILTDRNVRMAERSAARMRENPGKSYFFAYGAAHMPGDDGVVALLRKEGFEVTRLAAPASAAAAQ